MERNSRFYQIYDRYLDNVLKSALPLVKKVLVKEPYRSQDIPDDLFLGELKNALGVSSDIDLKEKVANIFFKLKSDEWFARLNSGEEPDLILNEARSYASLLEPLEKLPDDEIPEEKREILNSFKRFKSDIGTKLSFSSLLQPAHEVSTGKERDIQRKIDLFAINAASAFLPISIAPDYKDDVTPLSALNRSFQLHAFTPKKDDFLEELIAGLGGTVGYGASFFLLRGLGNLAGAKNLLQNAGLVKRIATAFAAGTVYNLPKIIASANDETIAEMIQEGAEDYGSKFVGNLLEETLKQGIEWSAEVMLPESKVAIDNLRDVVRNRSFKNFFRELAKTIFVEGFVEEEIPNVVNDIIDGTHSSISSIPFTGDIKTPLRQLLLQMSVAGIYSTPVQIANTIALNHELNKFLSEPLLKLVSITDNLEKTRSSKFKVSEGQIDLLLDVLQNNYDSIKDYDYTLKKLVDTYEGLISDDLFSENIPINKLIFATDKIREIKRKLIDYYNSDIIKKYAEELLYFKPEEREKIYDELWNNVEPKVTNVESRYKFASDLLYSSSKKAVEETGKLIERGDKSIETIQKKTTEKINKALEELNNFYYLKNAKDQIQKLITDKTNRLNELKTQFFENKISEENYDKFVRDEIGDLLAKIDEVNRSILGKESAEKYRFIFRSVADEFIKQAELVKKERDKTIVPPDLNQIVSGAIPQKTAEIVNKVEKKLSEPPKEVKKLNEYEDLLLYINDITEKIKSLKTIDSSNIDNIKFNYEKIRRKYEAGKILNLPSVVKYAVDQLGASLDELGKRIESYEINSFLEKASDVYFSRKTDIPNDLKPYILPNMFASLNRMYDEGIMRSKERSGLTRKLKRIVSDITSESDNDVKKRKIKELEGYIDKILKELEDRKRIKEAADTAISKAVELQAEYLKDFLSQFPEETKETKEEEKTEESQEQVETQETERDTERDIERETEKEIEETTEGTDDENILRQAQKIIVASESEIENKLQETKEEDIREIIQQYVDKRITEVPAEHKEKFSEYSSVFEKLTKVNEIILEGKPAEIEGEEYYSFPEIIYWTDKYLDKMFSTDDEGKIKELVGRFEKYLDSIINRFTEKPSEEIQTKPTEVPPEVKSEGKQEVKFEEKTEEKFEEKPEEKPEEIKSPEVSPEVSPVVSPEAKETPKSELEGQIKEKLDKDELLKSLSVFTMSVLYGIGKDVKSSKSDVVGSIKNYLKDVGRKDLIDSGFPELIGIIADTYEEKYGIKLKLDDLGEKLGSAEIDTETLTAFVRLNKKILQEPTLAIETLYHEYYHHLLNLGKIIFDDIRNDYEELKKILIDRKLADASDVDEEIVRLLGQRRTETLLKERIQGQKEAFRKKYGYESYFTKLMKLVESLKEKLYNFLKAIASIYQRDDKDEIIKLIDELDRKLRTKLANVRENEKQKIFSYFDRLYEDISERDKDNAPNLFSDALLSQLANIDWMYSTVDNARNREILRNVTKFLYIRLLTDYLLDKKNSFLSSVNSELNKFKLYDIDEKINEILKNEINISISDDRMVDTNSYTYIAIMNDPQIRNLINPLNPLEYIEIIQRRDNEFSNDLNAFENFLLYASSKGIDVNDAKIKDKLYSVFRTYRNARKIPRIVLNVIDLGGEFARQDDFYTVVSGAFFEFGRTVHEIIRPFYNGLTPEALSMLEDELKRLKLLDEDKKIEVYEITGATIERRYKNRRTFEDVHFKHIDDRTKKFIFSHQIPRLANEDIFWLGPIGETGTVIAIKIDGFNEKIKKLISEEKIDLGELTADLLNVSDEESRRIIRQSFNEYLKRNPIVFPFILLNRILFGKFFTIDTFKKSLSKGKLPVFENFKRYSQFFTETPYPTDIDIENAIKVLEGERNSGLVVREVNGKKKIFVRTIVVETGEKTEGGKDPYDGASFANPSLRKVYKVLNNLDDEVSIIKAKYGVLPITGEYINVIKTAIFPSDFEFFKKKNVGLVVTTSAVKMHSLPAEKILKLDKLSDLEKIDDIEGYIVELDLSRFAHIVNKSKVKDITGGVLHPFFSTFVATEYPEIIDGFKKIFDKIAEREWSYIKTAVNDRNKFEEILREIKLDISDYSRLSILSFLSDSLYDLSSGISEIPSVRATIFEYLLKEILKNHVQKRFPGTSAVLVPDSGTNEYNIARGIALRYILKNKDIFFDPSISDEEIKHDRKIHQKISVLINRIADLIVKGGNIRSLGTTVEIDAIENLKKDISSLRDEYERIKSEVLHNGKLKKNYANISLDIALKFDILKEKIEDSKIITTLTPSDNISSIYPAYVVGILSEKYSNALQHNSEVMIDVMGRDYDIDTLSLYPFVKEFWTYTEGTQEVNFFDVVFEKFKNSYEHRRVIKPEEKPEVEAIAKKIYDEPSDKFYKSIFSRFSSLYDEYKKGADINREFVEYISDMFLSDPQRLGPMFQTSAEGTVVTHRTFASMVAEMIDDIEIKSPKESLKLPAGTIRETIDEIARIFSLITNYAVDFPNDPNLLKFSTNLSVSEAIERFFSYFLKKLFPEHKLAPKGNFEKFIDLLQKLNEIRRGKSYSAEMGFYDYFTKVISVRKSLNELVRDGYITLDFEIRNDKNKTEGNFVVKLDPSRSAMLHSILNLIPEINSLADEKEAIKFVRNLMFPYDVSSTRSILNSIVKPAKNLISRRVPKEEIGRLNDAVSILSSIRSSLISSDFAQVLVDTKKFLEKIGKTDRLSEAYQVIFNNFGIYYEGTHKLASDKVKLIADQISKKDIEKVVSKDKNRNGYFNVEYEHNGKKYLLSFFGKASAPSTKFFIDYLTELTDFDKPSVKLLYLVKTIEATDNYAGYLERLEKSNNLEDLQKLLYRSFNLYSDVIMEIINFPDDAIRKDLLNTIGTFFLTNRFISETLKNLNTNNLTADGTIVIGNYESKSTKKDRKTLTEAILNKIGDVLGKDSIVRSFYKLAVERKEGLDGSYSAEFLREFLEKHKDTFELDEVKKEIVLDFTKEKTESIFKYAVLRKIIKSLSGTGDNIDDITAILRSFDATIDDVMLMYSEIVEGKTAEYGSIAKRIINSRIPKWAKMFYIRYALPLSVINALSRNKIVVAPEHRIKVFYDMNEFGKIMNVYFDLNIAKTFFGKSDSIISVVPKAYIPYYTLQLLNYNGAQLKKKMYELLEDAIGSIPKGLPLDKAEEIVARMIYEFKNKLRFYVAGFGKVLTVVNDKTKAYDIIGELIGAKEMYMPLIINDIKSMLSEDNFRSLLGVYYSEENVNGIIRYFVKLQNFYLGFVPAVLYQTILSIAKYRNMAQDLEHEGTFIRSELDSIYENLTNFYAKITGRFIDPKEIDEILNSKKHQFEQPPYQTGNYYRPQRWINEESYLNELRLYLTARKYPADQIERILAEEKIKFETEGYFGNMGSIWQHMKRRTIEKPRNLENLIFDIEDHKEYGESLINYLHSLLVSSIYSTHRSKLISEGENEELIRYLDRIFESYGYSYGYYRRSIKTYEDRDDRWIEYARKYLKSGDRIKLTYSIGDHIYSNRSAILLDVTSDAIVFYDLSSEESKVVRYENIHELNRYESRYLSGMLSAEIARYIYANKLKKIAKYHLYGDSGYNVISDEFQKIISPYLKLYNFSKNEQGKIIETILIKRALTTRDKLEKIYKAIPSVIASSLVFTTILNPWKNRYISYIIRNIAGSILLAMRRYGFSETINAFKYILGYYRGQSETLLKEFVDATNAVFLISAHSPDVYSTRFTERYTTALRYLKAGKYGKALENFWKGFPLRYVYNNVMINTVATLEAGTRKAIGYLEAKRVSSQAYESTGRQPFFHPSTVFELYLNSTKDILALYEMMYKPLALRSPLGKLLGLFGQFTIQQRATFANDFKRFINRISTFPGGAKLKKTIIYTIGTDMRETVEPLKETEREIKRDISIAGFVATTNFLRKLTGMGLNMLFLNYLTDYPVPPMYILDPTSSFLGHILRDNLTPETVAMELAVLSSKLAGYGIGYGVLTELGLAMALSSLGYEKISEEMLKILKPI